MLFDRHCSNRQPGTPIPAGIEVANSADIFQRTVVFLPEVSPEPACGAFYELEILYRPPTGGLKTFYIVGPRTFGNKGCAIGSVTPGLREFCMSETDPGPQGEFARADLGTQPPPLKPRRLLDTSSGVLGYRMRATSYDGRRSPWSDFVIPGQEECLPDQCPP